MTLKVGDRRHGTWQGYVDCRCRCPRCEAAIKGRKAAAELDDTGPGQEVLAL